MRRGIPIEIGNSYLCGKCPCTLKSQSHSQELQQGFKPATNFDGTYRRRRRRGDPLVVEYKTQPDLPKIFSRFLAASLPSKNQSSNCPRGKLLDMRIYLVASPNCVLRYFHKVSLYVILPHILPFYVRFLLCYSYCNIMFWSRVQLKPTWKEATSGRGEREREREDPRHAEPDIWTGERITGTELQTLTTATMVRGDNAVLLAVTCVLNRNLALGIPSRLPGYY